MPALPAPRNDLKAIDRLGGDAFFAGRVLVVTADITTLAVDAIVNAANVSLLGGGGVDGSIHRAAGPGLALECGRLGGCDPGDAKITGGHALPARHVIHTVGVPRPHGATPARMAEAIALMVSAWRRALEVASEHDLETIAFPLLGVGIFGWDLDQGCVFAAETITEFLRDHPKPRRVIVTALDAFSVEAAGRAFRALGQCGDAGQPVHPNPNHTTTAQGIASPAPAAKGTPSMATPRNAIGIFIQAVAFAADKHRTQRRRDAEESAYINHPIALANVLANEGGIEDLAVLCAAVLHDTVEDTKTTFAEVEGVFGPKVAEIVREGTDNKNLLKHIRKQHQIDHAPRISREAKLVKLADKICNLRDILTAPPAKWSKERKQDYFDWAAQVIAGVRGAHPGLEAMFDGLYARRAELN